MPVLELSELLAQRRMVRHYTDEPIARDALERVVATVQRAPSGGYSQGQRLIVVTDTKLRAEVSLLFPDDGGLEPWIPTAQALVVVCCRENDYHERYNRPDKLAQTGGVEIEWPAPYWFVDAGAALMLILLAAIDEGLGAGLFGVTVERMAAFKAIFRIPEDVSVVGVVTLGHPAPDPGWSERASRRTQRRRPLDEVVHWERWSS